MDDDMKQALAQQLVLNKSLIQMMFAREQLREAQRVPSMGHCYTANLAKITSGAALNIVPRMPSRSGFFIQNIGSETALFTFAQFDIGQAKATYATLAGNSVIRIGTLAKGAGISVETSAPLYACAAGTATQLLVVENVYTQSLTTDGQAGADWHGWHRIVGDVETLVKDLV